MKKKKGFTLIELLVVIAIIAMLLAILMPALGKVKKIAMRLVCGTNLKGMANAMNVYAFDYRDEYPIAGGAGVTTWSLETAAWADPSHAWNGPDSVSVAASLFMLVREADVGVKSFVCTASDQTAFVNETDQDVVELWDFGTAAAGDFGAYGPAKCQSYSYHQPYKVGGTHYPADGTSNPGNAIMADRNPWYDSKLQVGTPTGQQFLEFVGVLNPNEFTSGTKMQKWEEQIANAEAHDREGQNVLFNDGHVEFAKRSDVGTRYDNIYTKATPNTEVGRRSGWCSAGITSGGVANSEDSLLVNDELR